MTEKQKLKKVENLLWDIICAGGGDGETIREYAETILKVAQSK